jgi:hypothetical protein
MRRAMGAERAAGVAPRMVCGCERSEQRTDRRGHPRRDDYMGSFARVPEERGTTTKPGFV